MQQTNNEWQIATLTEKEQAALKEMENQLGYVLIAYEQNPQKASKRNS